MKLKSGLEWPDYQAQICAGVERGQKQLLLHFCRQFGSLSVFWLFCSNRYICCRNSCTRCFI